MIKWEFDSSDKEIIFLIKTMKKQYLNAALKKGELCFNYPTLFNSSKTLEIAQRDEWDSHTSIVTNKLFYAPIISEEKNKITYGQIETIADQISIRLLTAKNKQTPLCSFRTVNEEDFVKEEDVYRLYLGDTVDRIRKEFGHDSYILIFKPLAFLRRLMEVTSCYAHSVFYCDQIDNEYQEYLNNNYFEQKEMFQKGNAYSWQKEYRVILYPQKGNESRLVQIGSLEDIAYGGDIDDLKKGYVLGEKEIIDP